MSSLDYVSDSDDYEYELLSNDRISTRLLQNNLNKLSPRKRQETKDKLIEYTNYASLLQELSQGLISSQKSNDEVVNDSEEEVQDIFLQDSLRADDPQNSDSQNILDDPIATAHSFENSQDIDNNPTEGNQQTDVQVPEEPNTNDHEQEHENNHHLQNYLDSRSNVVSRRGLRKRNFASTHPYLADQAHYLGLSDVNYLNEIYEENNHDLETVVKYLNYNYVKLKQSNPRDEKYRSKNFYTILGKQSQSAQQKEKEEQWKESYDIEFQDPSQMNGDIDQDDLNGDYYSDDDELLESVNKHHSLVISDNEEGAGSDTNSDNSDTLVRVGGRYRHERNVLKGVLPESAKRLQIYKPRPKSGNRRDQQKQVEMRKGMAVRKSAPRPSSSRTNFYEFDGFVDESVVYDTSNELYHELYQNPDVDKNLVTDLERFETYSIISDSSNSEPEEADHSDNDLFSTSLPIENTSSDNQPQAAEEDTNYDFGYDDFGEVRESDNINMMLAGSSKKSKKSGVPPRKKQRIGASGAGNRGSSRLKQSHLPTSHGPPSTGSNRPRTVSRKRATPIKRRTGEPRGRLAVKSITIPKSTKRRHHKQKMSKKNGNLGSIDSFLTAINPDIDKNDYLFSRKPILSTTIFEAESDHRYVEERQSSSDSFIPNRSAQFSTGSILDIIDIRQIQKLEQGRSYQFHKDNFTITFNQQAYLFSLVNGKNSRLNAQRLVAQLVRTFKNSNLLFETISDSIYDCVRGLIQWVLMIQESPADRDWKLVSLCLDALISNHNMSPGFKKRYISYFALLHYTMSRMAYFSSGECMIDKDVQLFKYSRQYWEIFFDSFDLDQFDKYSLQSNCSTQDSESFHIIYTLLDLQNQWWKSITSAIETYHHPTNIQNLLEAVFCLCFIRNRGYSWNPLHLVFQKSTHLTNPEFFYRYIEMIYALNQRRGWPTEEKTILEIYGSITNRRFANFVDEIGMPELISSQVSSRFDIPDDTFFEQFMQLLYWYVSGLSEPIKVKRLVIKLFTSSGSIFNAVDDSQTRQVMFINRLNFLILLSSISNVDLNNQIQELFGGLGQVEDSEGDVVGLCKLASDALITFSEIIIPKKGLKLPVEAFIMLTNCFIKSYYTIPGIFKLWKRFLKQMNKLLVVQDAEMATSQFELLAMTRGLSSEMPDRLCFELFELYLKICINITPYKTKFHSMSNLKILHSLEDLVLKILHRQMGRIPLSSRSEEMTVSKFIELCISLWLRCSSLFPTPNWEKIVLQTFPYTGNVQSREKFGIYFYVGILRYYNLKGCKEMVTRSVLREITKFNSSIHLPTLLNHLNKDKWILFMYQKKLIPDEVTSILLKNSRHVIVHNFIYNLSIHTKLSTIDEQKYINDITKGLSTEYDKYYSSSWYKEFCCKVVKLVQRYFFDFITDDSLLLLSELASKLGIQRAELSLIELKRIPINDRLKTIHFECNRVVLFDKVWISKMDETLSGDIELLYHLVSIYVHEILKYEHYRWKSVWFLLKYFQESICNGFRYDICDQNFMKFLNMLCNIPRIRDIGDSEDDYFRLKSLRTTVDVLRQSGVTLEGYRESERITEFILRFIESYRTRDEEFESKYLYSSYNLSDILHGGHDSVFKRTGEKDSLQLIQAFQQDINNLESRYIPSNPTGCLEYEYDFDTNIEQPI
ncbi:uncharacterized protein J8A68_003295 [[Candida] subhashii]|uniref:Uncharacterized protein n=1 Tax=[Candida] subhashii TaxID=561895 RepID=A0A8J5UHV4_9ASCO|nr:uncharacterized protein J8A68_003295 [[Candida] subhashii]KAG7663213.1 hypothetical protein J8A68_003295 [[Candida] subhashii]